MCTNFGVTNFGSEFQCLRYYLSAAHLTLREQPFTSWRTTK